MEGEFLLSFTEDMREKDEDFREHQGYYSGYLRWHYNNPMSSCPYSIGPFEFSQPYTKSDFVEYLKEIIGLTDDILENCEFWGEGNAIEFN